MKRKKAYSYIRFSSPEQAKGDSLRRQLEDSEKWAKDNGYILDESIQDLGISAFTGKNKTIGALSGFLKKIEDGEIEKGSVLILESLDRLSREQILFAFGTFMSIISHDISIVSLSDDQIYTKENINDLGNLLSPLVTMSRAHNESLMKSNRSLSTWNKKRKDAIEKKTPMTKSCPHWLKLSKNRSQYKIIPERAALIKEIFDKTINGYGRRRIVKEFNLRGEKAWGRATSWRDTYIAKILKNRSVIGELQLYQKIDDRRTPVGDPIENFFPAVIEESTFYLAHLEIEKRTHKGGRRGKLFSNLFTGITRCADCESTMILINKGNSPKGAKYLVCDSNNRGAGCKNSDKIRYDKFEKFVLFNLAPQLNWQRDKSSEENIIKDAKQSLDTLKAKVEKLNRQVKRYQNLFEEIEDEDQINNLTTRFLEINKKHVEYKNKCEEEEANYKALTSSIVRSENEIKELYKCLKSIYEEQDEAKLYEIRTKVNQIFHELNIVFYFSAEVLDHPEIEDQYFFIGEKEDQKNLIVRNNSTSFEDSPWHITYSKERYMEVIKNESIDNLSMDFNSFKNLLIDNTIAI
jgi:DNA invertase Pin-like site-specific DNA recombinase